VTIAAVTSALPAAAASNDDASGWRRPVDGRVVRPFANPSTAFGAGHRGVDLAAPAGTPVRAAGAGTVTFAGDVAGALHVVVTHRNGLRTSYSFLADITVAVGDAVAAGAVVGHTGGTDPDRDHGPDTLHFGLRVGERYVDPLLLFQKRDLTELVRLVPVAPIGPDGSWEHANLDESTALEIGVGHELVPPDLTGDDGCASGVPVFGGVADAVCDAVDWAADKTQDALRAGLDVLKGAGRAGARLAARLGPELHGLLDDLRVVTAPIRARLLDSAAGRVLRDLVEIGQRMIEWATQHCDRYAPAADGTGGSGHALMAVGGIDSHSSGRDHRSFALDTDALGLDPEDVHWFSYAKDGGAYDRDDTERSLYRSAELLAAQLRERQAREPGRAVDLVAHSQGGVVVDIFLKLIYKPSDPSYPPLGSVVSLASPHEGAPLARSTEALRGSDSPRLTLDVIDELDDRSIDRLPRSDSPAVRQLDPDSDLMRKLQSTPLPATVHYVSVSGTDDWVVPADHTELEGATEVTVDVHGLTDDHTAILRDANALRAVRAALERRPPPCTSLLTAIRSAVEPMALSRVEGDLGEALVAYLEYGR
jgi:hypothetical protein